MDAQDRGLPFGENFASTFRVEGGMLKVAYDGYGDTDFANQFGHVFYARASPTT